MPFVASAPDATWCSVQGFRTQSKVDTQMTLAVEGLGVGPQSRGWWTRMGDHHKVEDGGLGVGIEALLLVVSDHHLLSDCSVTQSERVECHRG